MIRIGEEMKVLECKKVKYKKNLIQGQITLDHGIIFIYNSMSRHTGTIKLIIELI